MSDPLKNLENLLKSNPSAVLKTLNSLNIEKPATSGLDHKFWKTQPVPQEMVKAEESGPIEEDKDPQQIRQDPYLLPKGYEWQDVQVDNKEHITQLYQLLSENYVEDDDAKFRFNYSAEFISWAMKSPGWIESFHVGVFVSATKRLIGFISAIPCTIVIRGLVKKTVEINFLCVHKKLRSKRLAPVLIKEITRRVNLQGMFQAVYTAGITIPTPIASVQYFHRSLNPKKLVETGFSPLHSSDTIAKLVKRYKLSPEIVPKGWRAMTEKDVPTVTLKLNEYLSKFCLSQHFTENDSFHWFVPGKDIVFSYVIEQENEIVAFASFYCLPSTVVNHPVHKEIKAAYLYYYFSPKELLTLLFKSCLVAAKGFGFDVFNCLKMMDSDKDLLSSTGFGPGDGHLQYYLYNWRCPFMEPEDMGMTLF